MVLLDWLKLPYRASWRMVMEDEGLELSGYIAFTAFLALFPFLIFLAALAGFLGDQDAADRFIETMFKFMPDDVAGTLAPAVGEVMGSRQTGLLTLGILATLWFASSGIEALRVGLNRAYSVTEERPMWWLRLQSLALVIASGLVIFFLSLVVIIGPVVWTALGPRVNNALDTELVFLTARYLVAIVVLWVALMLFHQWLPNARQTYRRILPGVCLTVLLWLLGASVFSWYIGSLADYSIVYGSLGGVAITLVFFYITALIFIFGAEVNALWRHHQGLPDAPQAVDPARQEEG